MTGGVGMCQRRGGAAFERAVTLRAVTGIMAAVVELGLAATMAKGVRWP
ncbi:hypothetical protein GA0115260_101871, partial [Streptomyces sp. MnatMP-M27]